MNKRHTNIFTSVTCLTTGGLLYILFRENTFIGSAFSNIAVVDYFREWLKPISCDFLQFYLPDFLWGLALSCGLQAIFSLPKRRCILCGVAAFLSGTLWECLQFYGVFSGTGDFYDVVAYFFACALSIILNFKEREQ